MFVSIVADWLAIYNHISFMWSASASQANFAAVLELVGNVGWPECEVGAVTVVGTLLLTLW